ncbi:MAG TPA: hypothetical protein VIB62_08705 [Actinomycetota bacterium]
MSDDLKARLDVLGNRTADRGDAFERLTKIRERRERNRKRGALVLGLSVVLVGSVAAVSLFRDGTATLPRGSEAPEVATWWQPPDVLTVWPETPMDSGVAADVQARADVGDPDVQWRLDPELVAERFGLEFLAWSSADAHDLVPADGAVVLTLTPCPHAETCRAIGELRLILRQPARAGDRGIWSIASVLSDALRLQIPQGGSPASQLTGGSTIGFDVTLDPDAATSAHIGFVAGNGCSSVGSGTPALASGHHELVLPEAGPPTNSCGAIGAGYAFVFVTDDTTEPVSDPLEEPTAIEFPWLTVVPFYLEMERSDATATATPSRGVDTAGSASSTFLALNCAGAQQDVLLDADALTVEGDPTDEMAEFANEVFVRGGLGPGVQPWGPVDGNERIFVSTMGEGRIVGAVYFERSGDAWFPGASSSCSDIG